MEPTDNSTYGGAAFCPNCSSRLPYVLPVEPLYDLRLACMIIPMTHTALRNYLWRHREEFPRRYRQDRQKRLHRLLSASEIHRIRNNRLRFKDVDGNKREPGYLGS